MLALIRSRPIEWTGKMTFKSIEEDRGQVLLNYFEARDGIPPLPGAHSLILPPAGRSGPGLLKDALVQKQRR